MNSGVTRAGSIRALIVSALCVLLVEQPLLAAPTKPVRKQGVKATQIQGDERVLHALNRFTFGPRPGDVASVKAMGLQAWFEQQLNATSIEDSALEARLTMFPAMKMPQAELMQRYPAPQLLRQIINGRASMPAEPAEQAIYADRIAFYKARVKQAGTSGKDSSMKMEKSSASSGDDADSAASAMATREKQLYPGPDAMKIINLPPEERMQRLMAMSPEEMVNFRRGLTRRELADVAEGLTPEQKEMLASFQGGPRMIGAELVESRILRDVYSERQLEAVMTDFWLNHFNVYIRKNQGEPSLLPAYERDVIRPNALGKFEDLLVATAKSPAMLMYLDNWQSVGPDSTAAKRAAIVAQRGRNSRTKAGRDRGLNENYARELMELHTLGVQCEVSMDHPVNKLDQVCGNGYTQQDVTQVAEVLTGWTVDQPYRSGEYRFEERRHEPGVKSLLGTTISEGGEAEGMQVLHMLATSPATAKFISTKLAVRFVSDTPPPALVDRMTKAFLASDGDIKTVLRTMFDSPEFWSPAVYRAKLKTPEEFVVSAVRASGAEVKNALPLTQATNKLGMPLYGMQTPNGYNWTAGPWVNTGDLVNRMNFALSLSGNKVPGARTDWTRMLAEAPDSTAKTAGASDVEVKEKRLEGLLLGSPVSDRTRATVLEQFRSETVQEQAEKNFGTEAMDTQEPMDGVMRVAAQGRQRQPQDREAATMAGLLLGSPEFQRR